MKILTSRDDAYSVGAERKNHLHRTTANILRKLADALGLVEGTYDIRSNKGGPAVSGEVTLHGENIYVQVGGMGGILVRSCKGRKDYTGGPNNFAPVKALEDPEAFAEEVKKVINGGWLSTRFEW